MASHRNINHIQISTTAFPSAAQYCDDVHARAEDLRVNTAPYDETINKVNEAIENIDKECDMMYNRIADLETQRAELIDVGNEAGKTRDNVYAKHRESLGEANAVFFGKLAVQANVPALADLDKDWEVDLNYVDSFQVMYICERLPEALTSEPGEGLDDDLSNWMNDINN